MYHYITPQQAQSLLALRPRTTKVKRNQQRALFHEIKIQHNIPQSTKLSVFIENPGHPMYCLLRNKRSKIPYDCGKPYAQFDGVVPADGEIVFDAQDKADMEELNQALVSALEGNATPAPAPSNVSVGTLPTKTVKAASAEAKVKAKVKAAAPKAATPKAAPKPPAKSKAPAKAVSKPASKPPVKAVAKLPAKKAAPAKVAPVKKVAAPIKAKAEVKKAKAK